MKSAPLLSAKSVCSPLSGEVSELHPVNMAVEPPSVPVVSMEPIDTSALQPLNIESNAWFDGPSVIKLPSDVSAVFPLNML